MNQMNEMWLKKESKGHYIMMDAASAGKQLTDTHKSDHMTDPRINRTIEAFGYPANMVADFGEWIVLVRPKQVTLGSVVIAAAHPATSFAELPPLHFTTLGNVMGRVETALKTLFHCDKVNYLALMMVDPHVHFHVIPRYAQAATFTEHSFPDTFWPKPPDVTQALDVSPETFKMLTEALKNGLA
jgi:diadenosine tetraphosphate (Ap4A) HIT family hydrolase